MHRVQGLSPQVRAAHQICTPRAPAERKAQAGARRGQVRAEGSLVGVERQGVRRRGRGGLRAARRIPVLRAVPVDADVLLAGQALRVVLPELVALRDALAEGLALLRGHGGLEGRGALDDADRVLERGLLRGAVLRARLHVRHVERAVRLDLREVVHDGLVLALGHGEVLVRLLDLLLRGRHRLLVRGDALRELLLLLRERLHGRLIRRLRLALVVNGRVHLLRRLLLDELKHLDDVAARVALPLHIRVVAPALRLALHGLALEQRFAVELLHVEVAALPVEPLLLRRGALEPAGRVEPDALRHLRARLLQLVHALARQALDVRAAGVRLPVHDVGVAALARVQVGVVLLEYADGPRQDLLRLLRVRQRRLEDRVRRLAGLRLRGLRLAARGQVRRRRLDVVLRVRQHRVQVAEVGREGADVRLLVALVLLVRRLLVVAPRDLGLVVLLLLGNERDGLVDHLEHLREGVPRGGVGRDLREAQGVERPRRGAERLHDRLAASPRAAAVRVVAAHQGLLEEEQRARAAGAGGVHGPEGVARVVRVEDRDGLGDRRLLPRAQRHALLVLLLLHRAAVGEVRHEGLVLRLEALRGLELLGGRGDLLGVRADQLLLRALRLGHLRELRLLHLHEVVVLRLRLLLRRARGREVRLEGVEHVLQHAHDLPGLGVVVPRSLDERLELRALVLGEEEGRLAQGLLHVLGEGGDAALLREQPHAELLPRLIRGSVRGLRLEHGLRVRRGVIRREHRVVRAATHGLVRPDVLQELDSALELVNPGDHVRLGGEEVRVLLVADGGGLLARSLVVVHVLLELRHLLAELRVARAAVGQQGLHALDARGGISDGGRLLLRGLVAKTLEGRVHVTVLLPVGLALVQHALQQLHHLGDSLVLPFTKSQRRSSGEEQENPHLASRPAFGTADLLP